MFAEQAEEFALRAPFDCKSSGLLCRYSQEQLYAVVAGVEHYKEFVPWCQRSDIIDKKPPGYVEAELEVGFKMFVERYVSSSGESYGHRLPCAFQMITRMVTIAFAKALQRCRSSMGRQLMVQRCNDADTPRKCTSPRLQG